MSDYSLTTRKRCRGNLRPAPFFLAPHVVAGVLNLAIRPAPKSVAVPVLPTKLVDRPRASEDPRLAGANDVVPEVSGKRLLPPPGETIRSGEDGARGAASENLLASEAAPQPIPSSEPASGRAPATAQLPRRGNPTTQTAEPARKVDVMHRQAKDRDARELERPVDRMAVIRAAARKLALPASTSDCRPVPGVKTESPKITFPPLPALARRQRLQAAIAHLKRQCILVSPIDRSALVLRYRVSGKRDAMYAEDVIAFAATRGFDAEGAAK